MKSMQKMENTILIVSKYHVLDVVLFLLACFLVSDMLW